MTSPMMQLLNLLGRVGVSLSAMRAELSLSVEPADLERLDVQPAFRAIVAKPHFVYVGFTHKERLAA